MFVTKIIGILNCTPNSFSDGGEFINPTDAVARVEKLFMDGANIVDIGAVSTSYNAPVVDHHTEWMRLSPVLKALCKTEYRENLSVDTFCFETARKAIDLGITIINDVSGGKDDAILKLVASSFSIKYIMMCSLVVPADNNIRVPDENALYSALCMMVDKAMASGIQKGQMILDPGIGFTTNPALAFAVIKNIANYQKLDVPICVGHSRKSYLETFVKLPPQERDIETLAASLYMVQHKVDYLRVHNVAIHRRALNVFIPLLQKNID